jgi:hypothetical protein
MGLSAPSTLLIANYLFAEGNYLACHQQVIAISETEWGSEEVDVELLAEVDRGGRSHA